jgi:hypothetical protein
MTSIKLFFVLSAAVLASCVSSQTSTVEPAESDVEWAEFHVEGVCGECEERIERAALINGVRSAEWDRHTEIIKVIFVPAKVTVDDIQKAIAAVGHDTDNYKAPDEVYRAMPQCCWYRDGADKH